MAGGLQPERGMREPSDARKRTLALQERVLRFSVAVNAACPSALRDLPSSTVWRQLVRAADSVSNNLLEADDASSRADFIHKMRLALREAKESRLCLAKVRMGCLAGHDRLDGLEQEATELSAIFAAIVLRAAKSS
jgi:four helix bundle protein